LTTRSERHASRIDRLAGASDIAAKLRPIVEDMDIKAHLDGIERKIIEAMIAAKTTEDRDRHAAEVKAWRAMRAELARLAFSGAYADRKLEAITKDTENV
jgi:hypothetical protein